MDGSRSIDILSGLPKDLMIVFKKKVSHSVPPLLKLETPKVDRKVARNISIQYQEAKGKGKKIKATRSSQINAMVRQRPEEEDCLLKFLKMQQCLVEQIDLAVIQTLQY